MPPAMPMVSACWVAWSTAWSALETWVRPKATPAADRMASRMTARPLAESQPKKAAPHLMPPKRSCWASTASRAAPRVARAPASTLVCGWLVAMRDLPIEVMGWGGTETSVGSAGDSGPSGGRPLDSRVGVTGTPLHEGRGLLGTSRVAEHLLLGAGKNYPGSQMNKP